ncbi:BlaR1 family beta-lactam sensor/signal transducer [Paenibacillus ihbetae]|uniref:BlaR1 family beta-lactam sensor/signal transducer n=1 Tax=Paenibacillus ihbetae TaxID=1870820 RepID=A0ABX3JRY1_9BACL|nr:BlaR1 family beta-lactam sensor/signal transducer [Paenibacillus ihbetae]OOC58818.1 BlaR1 family beta-lactam sensor/signal transducer [Paenibacillus ihbetae]
MLFSMLVAGCIVSSISAAGMMGIKAVFRKQLTAKWHYRIWMLLLLALAIPFMPGHLFQFSSWFPVLGGPLHRDTGVTGNGAGVQDAADANMLQDFTISVNRGTPEFLQTMTVAVWIAGLLVFALMIMRAWLDIRRMKNAARPVSDEEVLAVLEQCKQQLHITREMVVLESPLVQSPMLAGALKPCLMLPSRCTDWVSTDEVRYILLHELNHWKSRDNLTNYGIVAFQAIYWFNPLIWMALKQMRLDREIACDHAVLQSLDERFHGDYGQTILRFASRASQSAPFPLASPFVGPKSPIRHRIETIVRFRADSRRENIKSLAVVALAALMVASQLPVAEAVNRDDSRYVFSDERTEYEDLSAYFSDYEGSFVLYDLNAGQYRIYNESQSTRRVSPDSTYKIYSALFGLESGAIADEHSTIEWNGQINPYDAWNQDHNLFTAMASSVNWYFQAMENRMGRGELQGYLERIGYGNADLSGKSEPFWLESSLAISPVEQVQLLKALYTNQFGFKDKHIETVKQAIQLQERGGARLFGKTGTGTVHHKNTNGWFVGYVENGGNVYFFATNIRHEDQASGSKAADIALRILQDKGIY